MTISARSLRAILASTVLGLSPALAGVALAASAPAATIRWDQYKVPHIYGADIPTVVRGLGYAQMENHVETLLNNVVRSRGRSAEFLGPGTANFNLLYDKKIRTYGIAARAKQWVTSGTAFQRTILQAFCDGVNEYARLHPDDILPQLKPILPVVPADITAGEQATIWYTFLPETSGLPGQASAFIGTTGSGVGVALLGDDAAAPLGGRAVGQSPRQLASLIHQPHTQGSNGWAIGPSKSTSGNAILMGNPHLEWGVNQPISNSDANQAFGVYQWVEANLVVGDPAAPTLNASGVTFVGGPFIGVGFTDKVGWTHTNNTIKNADLYKLTLDSTHTKYKFGNNFLPLTHRTEIVKSLQADGTMASEVLDIYTSIHGPIVAFNADRSEALALRIPGLDQPSLADQYWKMIQAQNVTEFKAAESALQMPFFNTMFADSSGEIFYLFGGRQPVRAAGTVADYSGVLDGADPKMLWTKTMSFAQLPQATNPPNGWVANSNNPPWNSVLPVPASLNPANYPSYIAPITMDFRPQHGASFLVNSGKLSRNAVLVGKMSTKMSLADSVVGDLITMANASTDPRANAAATILAAWDHTADATSVGGVLFEEWWHTVTDHINANDGKIVADTSLTFVSSHPKFRIPWDAANPITTSIGLDPVNTTQLVADLVDAFNKAQTKWGAAPGANVGGASAPWGGAHKTTLVTRTGPNQDLVFPFLVNSPNSGTDDQFGPLRVVNSYYIGALKQFISHGGDGYVQVVEFTPTGSVGGTLLTYGNESRPHSTHITDQLPFYDSKTLRPALRTLSAVTAATVSTENY